MPFFFFFFENFSLKTTQKSQSYINIMVVDIDLLKYHSVETLKANIIRFFWIESKSAQLFIDLTWPV